MNESKKKSNLGSGRIAVRLLGALKPYWGLALLCLLVYAGSRGLFLFTPWVEGQFLDRVFGEKDVDYLFILVGVWFGIAFATYLTSLGTGYFVSKITGQTRRDMQLKVYQHLRFLPCRFYDNHTTGQIMAYVNTDTGAAAEGILASGWIVAGGVEFVITLVVVFWVNPWLGLFSIPFTLAVVYLPVLFRRPVQNASKQVLQERESISSRLQEGIAGSREIKSLGHEMRDMGFIGGSLNTLVRAEVRQAVIGGLTALGPLASWLGNPLFFFIGGKMVIDGDISVGFFWMATRYLNLLTFPLYRCQNEYQKLLRAGEGAKRVFAFLEENPTETQDGITGINLQGKVRFEDVTFGYNETEPVLENVTFEVQPGQLVALVGPSGAGKSTLLNLIPRFREPTQGHIYVDAHDISTLNLRVLRSQMGTVFQDPYLFSGSIEENIRMGARHPERVRQDDIIAAATAANAHSFITQLTDGYATEIGERGIKLSGGERQRIAIARVLLRNPKMLLLDEATSALDSETERVVTEALERLMKGRTSFVIAHRLSTVLNADVILAMENGKILEAGTHQELLTQDGLYARLYHLQFATSG
ncbi:ABC transporter ATP-binding protein [Candidatus Poribacteria bacterium]|nr:ABC transporter ATP-binding protein [Candidatus Poribacteria bacterium]MYH79571.1 ABC transporter ATP-binding protein [Candidatus Poribacteria bacterium]MYK97192.1 ABC transporter ATP-binding protein [Candidatus Poribacteria bacterium]